MTGFAELFKEYASDKYSIKLSNFISDNKKTVDLYCFNEGNGSHAVLGTYYIAEKGRRAIKHKPNAIIKDTTRKLLKPKVCI
jgi:hypothetical protein